MPRIRACRVLKLLALPWIVLFGLWVFLPSPTIRPDQRATYIQSTLASGRSLVSVVDYAPFRRHPDRAYSGECTECSSLLFHWRLVDGDNSILLRLNEYTSVRDAAQINITGIFEQANKWHFEQRHKDWKDWTIYFSGPLLLPEIAAGNDDEEINLPWFATADKHLFHNDMHGFTASPIVLRAIVPRPGIVEIWRFSATTKVMSQYYNDVSEDGRLKGHNNPRSWELIYKNLKKHEQNQSLVATFKVPEVGTTRDITVEGLKGELPSRTYGVRKALLFPLGPFISLPFLVVGTLWDSSAPLVSFAVLTIVAYILYRLTRYVMAIKSRARKEKAHVWGPTGPLEGNNRSSWSDLEKGAGLPRPQIVRLGRSWKD